MTRNATRTSLVTLALLTLTACVVNLSFEIKKSAALQSQTGATSVSQTVPVDLGGVKEITDHKNNIKSLDLDYLDATVTAVNSANTAHTVSGTVVLRQSLTDKTHDVPVGTLTNVSIATGSTVRLNGSPALDAFLLQQLQSAGTFYVVVDGTVDGRADLVLDLDLHASIGYDAGLF